MPRYGSQVHFFKRRIIATVITGAAGAPDIYGFAFYSLANVNGAGDLINLYDRYKITGVKTTFVWNNNQGSLLVTQPQNAFPVLHTLVDADDANAPTSVNGLLEYSKTKTRAFSNSRNVISVYFRPTPLTMLWNQVAATQQAAGLSHPTWLATLHSNIAHYGLKYAVENLGTNNEISVYHTYYLAMKDVRG